MYGGKKKSNCQGLGTRCFGVLSACLLLGMALAGCAPQNIQHGLAGSSSQKTLESSRRLSSRANDVLMRSTSQDVALLWKETVPVKGENPTKTAQTQLETEKVEENPPVEEEHSPVEPGSKGTKVALTFDDGPNGATTERILRILEENGGKGTFFMLGNRVGSFPETVRKVYESGSEIGNHSYDHASLTRVSASRAQYEMEQPQKLISAIVPYQPKLFRPPYGASNPAVRGSSQIPFVLWSVDTMDWKTRDRDSVVQIVLQSVKDGDIILMHDLYPSTADACEIIIPELRRMGYQLVTVSELLESEGVVPVAGKVYS